MSNKQHLPTPGYRIEPCNADGKKRWNLYLDGSGVYCGAFTDYDEAVEAAREQRAVAFDEAQNFVLRCPHCQESCGLSLESRLGMGFGEGPQLRTYHEMVVSRAEWRQYFQRMLDRETRAALEAEKARGKKP